MMEKPRSVAAGHLAKLLEGNSEASPVLMAGVVEHGEGSPVELRLDGRSGRIIIRS